MGHHRPLETSWCASLGLVVGVQACPVQPVPVSHLLYPGDWQEGRGREGWGLATAAPGPKQPQKERSRCFLGESWPGHPSL